MSSAPCLRLRVSFDAARSREEAMHNGIYSAGTSTRTVTEHHSMGWRERILWRYGLWSLGRGRRSLGNLYVYYSILQTPRNSSYPGEFTRVTLDTHLCSVSLLRLTEALSFFLSFSLSLSLSLSLSNSMSHTHTRTHVYVSTNSK